MIVLTTIMFTVVTKAGKFYKPAEYRWYLESLDLSAGLRPSQPMCRVISKGVKSPIIIKPKVVFKKIKNSKEISCTMVFRQGLTGKIFSSIKFKTGEVWKIPYLPADFYSVLIKCFSAKGDMLSSTVCCLNILEDNTKQKIKPVVNNNVFAVSIVNGKLVASGLPFGALDTELHVIGRNQYGNKVFEQFFKIDSEKKSGIFKLSDIEPGQFLSLSVLLENPKEVIDRINLFYYKRGSYPASVPDWTKNTPPAKLSTDSFIVHENQSLKGTFKSNIRGLNALVKGMKERGSDMLNIGFRWNHIEPVSGVFDWSEADKYIKFFTDRHIRFGLIIGGGIFNGTPYDTWGEWMMDSTGECQVWRGLCVTSPASKKFRKTIKNFIQAVFKRYGNNPYFVSWTFSGQGLDSGIFMDHFNKVNDYSPWARREFVHYLKSHYQTLDKLNSAWETNFSSWSLVNLPLPDWSKKVDISQAWIDFNACKLKIYIGASTALYDPIVRELDKTRKISHYLTYTGPIEYAFPDMIVNKSHLNDGGGEAQQMVRLYSIAANWGIRRQPESHYVPPAKRLQLQDMITNALRYGFKNYDLGMVWNSMVNIHATHYPKNTKLAESMKFWTSIVPVLRNLTKSKPVAPALGFILSWDDVFYRTRAWRWYALPGDQLQKAAAKASLGNVPWLSGITPNKIYDRLQMLVCDYDNQVFSPELLDKLERFVKNGGSLVLCSTAGEFTVGSKKKYLWRKRLNAPEKLNSSVISEWKLGKGKVIYSKESVASSSNGEFLIKMMQRCGVGRKVISSNPAVQGFLLKDANDLILVISAFNGFDSLRKLKNKKFLSTSITLPYISNGKWKFSQVYPKNISFIKNKKLLTNIEIKEEIEPSGLIIYRINKIKDRR